MKNQYDALYDAFKILNDELFNGELPQILVTISNPEGNKKCAGYYHHHVWNNGVSEIALIRAGMTLERGDAANLATLLHEMCHQWQCEVGTPSRNGYHNKEWANKMLEVGLQPIGLNAKGEPNGKSTGQNATHEIMPEGAAATLINGLIRKGWKIPLHYTNEPRKKPIAARKPSSKYSCQSCDMTLTGKPGLTVVCGDCRIMLDESN